MDERLANLHFWQTFPRPAISSMLLYCTHIVIGDDDGDASDDDGDDGDDDDDGDAWDDDDDAPLLPLLECCQVWENADVEKGFKELLIRFRTQLLIIKIAHV